MASDPFLDFSGLLTVNQTSLTIQYTFTVPANKKARIYEVSVAADSAFRGSTVAGQIDLRIKGRSILSNTSRRLLENFTIDRTANPIMLDQNEMIELLALVASSSGVLQIMVQGDLIPASEAV